MNGFNTDYSKAVIIAYRLADESVRNHYDSVMKIELNDIFACSQMIADGIAHQEIVKLQNETIVIEDSVIDMNTEG